MAGNQGQPSPYFDPNRGYREQLAERLADNRAVFERLGNTANSIVHHELPVETGGEARSETPMPVDLERVANLTAEARQVITHFQAVVEEIRSFNNHYDSLLVDIDADDDFFNDQPDWAQELIELSIRVPDMGEISLFRGALEPIDDNPQQ